MFGLFINKSSLAFGIIHVKRTLLVRTSWDFVMKPFMNRPILFKLKVGTFVDGKHNPLSIILLLIDYSQEALMIGYLDRCAMIKLCHMMQG